MVEGESTEYKESLADKENILRTAVAFANTKGGKIEIGINDKGNVVGVHIKKHDVENLARWITEEIRPAVYPSIGVKKMADQEIIEIQIEESPVRPHFYKGAAYLRIGRINKAMEPHEMERFMRKKIRTGYDELSSDASLDEIEEKKVIEFVQIMKYAGRKKVEYHTLEHALRALGVYVHHTIINAGAMAFGKDAYALFPQLSFRCVFRSGGEVRDYLFATGTLLEIEKDVELFLERNLKRKVQIEGFERKEYLEIPLEALREAIFNSLVHRDYFHPAGNYLEIGEEEVVIKNPGVLPEGLKISELYEKHDSIPRNRILASLTYLAGKIEQWGEGTLRIIQETMRAGLQKPVFREERGFFYVIFKRRTIGKEERHILELFKKRKEISSRYAAQAIKISERKARSILASLASAGIVIKHGKTKSSFYSL